MQIWNGSDEYCWRYRADTILSTDGQTDGRTDGQTDKVIPVYPPINFVEAGGIIIRTYTQGVFRVGIKSNFAQILPSQRMLIEMYLFYENVNIMTFRTVITIVADAPALCRRQDVCNHHADLTVTIILLGSYNVTYIAPRPWTNLVREISETLWSFLLLTGLFSDSDYGTVAWIRHATAGAHVVLVSSHPWQVTASHLKIGYPQLKLRVPDLQTSCSDLILRWSRGMAPRATRQWSNPRKYG